MALALPDDGRLLACDVSDEYTRGRPSVLGARRSRGQDRASPGTGARDARCRLAAGAAGQFDFAFIDADKTGYDAYHERCLQLLRAGGLIAIDNTLVERQVAHPASDADTVALQRLNAKLHADERIDLSLLPIGDGLIARAQALTQSAQGGARSVRQPIRPESRRIVVAISSIDLCVDDSQAMPSRRIIVSASRTS